MKQQSRFGFWTPSGTRGRLPVLYLLHGGGGGDNEHSWLDQQIGNVAGILGPDPQLRVRNDQAGRAIAGLSMGGWQALGVLLRSPGMFSALGNFSGTVQLGFSGATTPRIFDRPLRAQQLPPLAVFYHTCGSQDERFIQSNIAFVSELDAAGIPNVHDFPDGDHNWQFWQGALGRFANHLGKAGWGAGSS